MSNAATSHPGTVTRTFPLWRRLIYLAVIAIQAIMIFVQGRHLDNSYRQQVEYAKQASTLIAENRRLREHCPPEPTSGSLALR
jgi:hypothetical protein